ncbi:hypothetical protein AGMMS50225_03020 [Betaproteobacteria bacterium]|nr:hypothetical protein AGMMS50225_03020 [Betaproteobacteria bacterium]
MSRNTKSLGQDGFAELGRIGEIIIGRTITIFDVISEDDWPDDVVVDKHTAMIIQGMIEMAGQVNSAKELRLDGPDWADRVTEFLVHWISRNSMKFDGKESALLIGIGASIMANTQP